jgi:hypothetical protein
VSTVVMKVDDARAFEMIDTSSNCHVFSVDSESEAKFWMLALKAASLDALSGPVGTERAKAQQQLLTTSLRALHFHRPKTPSQRRQSQVLMPSQFTKGSHPDLEANQRKSAARKTTTRPSSTLFSRPISGEGSVLEAAGNAAGNVLELGLGLGLGFVDEVIPYLGFKSSEAEEVVGTGESVTTSSAQKDDTVRLSPGQEHASFLDLHEELKRDMAQKVPSIVG